ncbi:hypothetical protein ACTMTI_25740 [Nonomuraea sp. H19]|uniref:amidohydrolase family protein n=1 Tax=Nonomuraea sp. H19 TaxID=3452206 RepID=UPI003F8B93F5
MENGTLLVRDGHLYTADESARTHRAGSVLAVNGRIVAVGETPTVDLAAAALSRRERASLRTIDASGMLILPGFVNAHWHEVLARGLSQFGPQDYLPGRPGTASGVTLGLAVSVGGLSAPALGAAAEAYGPQGVFTILCLVPVAAVMLGLFLPRE